jgi:hypothetical protein
MRHIRYERDQLVQYNANLNFTSGYKRYAKIEAQFNKNYTALNILLLAFRNNYGFIIVLYGPTALASLGLSVV